MVHRPTQFKCSTAQVSEKNDMKETFDITWTVNDIVENWGIPAIDAEMILIMHRERIWDAAYDAVLTEIHHIVEERE